MESSLQQLLLRLLHVVINSNTRPHETTTLATLAVCEGSAVALQALVAVTRWFIVWQSAAVTRHTAEHSVAIVSHRCSMTSRAPWPASLYTRCNHHTTTTEDSRKMSRAKTRTASRTKPWASNHIMSFVFEPHLGSGSIETWAPNLVCGYETRFPTS